MKQIRTIKRYLLPGFTLFFSVACSEKYIPDDATPGTAPGGVVNVGLFADAGEFEKPVATRASANENDPAGILPWVLVFRGDNNVATFFEASRAVISNGRLVVPLTKTTNKSQLLILANPPDKFFDGTTDNLNLDKAGITNALSGKTYVQVVVGIMNTQKLDSPQPANPYGGGYIPMSASVTLNSIDGQTTIGTPSNKLPLTRIVAKVTVENTSSNFSLEGFTVTGAKQYGRFFESASLITPGNSVDYLAPGDPVGGISPGNQPVYIYESLASETSVIIKGKYNSETSYYRLVFKDAYNNQMAIGRNKWYRFTIKDVKLPGYKTYQEARTAPPSNIMAELLVIDPGSMEIVDNGQYYLGLSNSKIEIYSDGEHNGLIATTLTTNVPAGISPTIEILFANPANSMTAYFGAIAINGTVKSTDVKINLTDLFTDGSLKITVGNLIRTVEIDRYETIPPSGVVILFTLDYVAARIDDQGTGGAGWLTLSTDGVRFSDSEVVRTDNTRSIYLKARQSMPGYPKRTGGIAYITRKDKRGYLKMYIDQQGN